jgi:hypothetical protein
MIAKAPKKKKPGGTRKKIDYDQVYKLGSIQCTHAEIAAFLDIDIATLTRRLKSDPKLAQTLKKGQEEGRISLRRKQWQMALAGDKTMAIWLGKQHLDQADRQEHDHTGQLMGELKIKYIDSNGKRIKQ